MKSTKIVRQLMNVDASLNQMSNSWISYSIRDGKPLSSNGKNLAEQTIHLLELVKKSKKISSSSIKSIRKITNISNNIYLKNDQREKINELAFQCVFSSMKKPKPEVLQLKEDFLKLTLSNKKLFNKIALKKDKLIGKIGKFKKIMRYYGMSKRFMKKYNISDYQDVTFYPWLQYNAPNIRFGKKLEEASFKGKIQKKLKLKKSPKSLIDMINSFYKWQSSYQEFVAFIKTNCKQEKVKECVELSILESALQLVKRSNKNFLEFICSVENSAEVKFEEFYRFKNSV